MLLFISSKLFACDCETPKIALEAYNSDYVFKGKVTQKFFSKDLSLYTITVKVLKHYKNSDSLPQEFKFTLPSRHNIEKTSCDYFIDKYEELLLYIKKKEDLSYGFDLMCSNSKKITNKQIRKTEMLILENINQFDIDNYVLEYARGFNSPKPLVNVDSIINLFNDNKTEPQKFSIVTIDLDKEGKLIKANLTHREGRIKYNVVDTIFGLNYIKNEQYHKPRNNFEELILKISEKITYWTPYKNLRTGKAVRFRKFLIFQSNNKGEITVEY